MIRTNTEALSLLTQGAVIKRTKTLSGRERVCSIVGQDGKEINRVTNKVVDSIERKLLSGLSVDGEEVLIMNTL